MFLPFLPVAILSFTSLAFASPLSAQLGSSLSTSVDLALEPSGGSVGSGGAMLGSGGSHSGFDDFNRPNGPLGSDWSGGTGSFSVINNQFSNSSGGNAWIEYNAASSLYDVAVIEFDLLSNPVGLNYCAAITGAGGSDNTFTKVQSNSSQGVYDYIGYYRGNGSNGPVGYGLFSAITPVTGGRVRVYVTDFGDTMNVDIDEDLDGVFEYHYENPGLVSSGLASNLGEGVGLGAFGFDSRADNFSVNGAGPEPVLEVVEIIPNQYMTIDVSNLQEGSNAVVVLSSLGSGPTESPYGELAVSFPWRNTPPFPADADGVVNFTTTIPIGATGATFYIQAVELKTDLSSQLTNALEVLIP